MKIQINKALKEGFSILKNNPVIFLPLIFAGIIAFFTNRYLAGLVEDATAMITYLSGEEIDLSLLFSSLPIIQIVLTLLLGGIVSFYFLLTTIKLTHDSFKKTPSMGGAFTTAIKRFIPVFLASVLIFLLLAAAACISLLILTIISALNVPQSVLTVFFVFFALLNAVLMIFLQVKLIFYPYTGVIDAKGTIDSLKTSWRMTKGNFWQIILLTLITMAVALLLMIIAAPFPQSVAPFIGAIVQILTTGWAISVFTSSYLQIKS